MWAHLGDYLGILMWLDSRLKDWDIADSVLQSLSTLILLELNLLDLPLEGGLFTWRPTLYVPH